MGIEDRIKEVLTDEQYSKWMYTSNGDLIRPNLMVWTNDWRWEQVDAEDFELNMTTLIARHSTDDSWKYTSDDFWFRCKSSPTTTGRTLLNGERMTAVCPKCYSYWIECHQGGCGLSKERNWTEWK